MASFVMDFHVTEFFPGLGTLTHALTRGLARVGSVSVAAAAEINGRYLQLFSRQHPNATTFLGSLTQYAPAELSLAGPGVRVLVAGIPCTGASLSGRAKRGLAAAEMHPDVGQLFLPVLHHVTHHRPDLCVFENVPAYSGSLSATIIRQHLRSLGYQVFERIVNPHTEFETTTERIRWTLVASRLGAFRWLFEPRPFHGPIEPLLDPVTPRDRDDEFTREQVDAHTRYCERKASEGCGFSRRILDRSDSKVPTIPRSYGKVQPTGVFLRSGDTYRLLRPGEVARIHGFDGEFVSLLSSLPQTLAYEVLGQGVVARPFEALGEALGNWVCHQLGSATAA